VTKVYDTSNPYENYLRVQNNRIVIDGAKFTYDFGPAKQTSVAVFMDGSYQATYGGTNEINVTMDGAAMPFLNRWNIKLKPTFLNTSSFPTDSCTLPSATECNSGICGANCYPDHHKNITRNLEYLRDQLAPLPLYKSSDLFLGVTACKICWQKNGVHNTYILGLSYTTGKQGMVLNNKTRGQMLNVRVIQHELSHIYGCTSDSKAQCTPYKDCIMSGGFDQIKQYDLPSIWCDHCSEEFNRALH